MYRYSTDVLLLHQSTGRLAVPGRTNIVANMSGKQAKRTNYPRTCSMQYSYAQ